MTTTKTINLPRYLEALAMLPGVTEQDVAKIRGEFASRFSAVPEEVTFHRGEYKEYDGGYHDGSIHIHRIFTSRETFNPKGYTLTPWGWNSPHDYFAAYGPHTEASRLSFGFFVGGVFGDVQQAGAQLVFGLYECSSRGRSLDTCLNRPRIHQLRREVAVIQQKDREIEELRARTEAAEQDARALRRLNAKAKEPQRKTDRRPTEIVQAPPNRNNWRESWGGAAGEKGDKSEKSAPGSDCSPQRNYCPHERY